ncbi:TPA: hypothetical protein HA273_06310 [Candidatus Bathyarchaeota archaeon]|nr:hypothetical protein [Candidatus Bathyarchaeota archaeon]HIJ08455.1 hypothetical protein [Candidatus Bathyarchaeota archaeon]
MRSKEEIRKMLEALEKEHLTEGPFTERQNIARIAARKAMEWVLEDKDSPLTY